MSSRSNSRWSFRNQVAEEPHARLIDLGIRDVGDRLEVRRTRDPGVLVAATATAEPQLEPNEVMEA